MSVSLSARLLAGAAVLAVAAALPAMPAAAQDAQPGAETERVVVTGTRGRPRSALTTPVPVDVFSQRQIQTAGALGGEFGQALQNLVPSFNFQRQSNSGSADIVRPAQLRGMSPDQVLVLVNGKRRHTTSITTIDAKVGRGTAPVDFNSIPTNAIGRIEVLRDGAGAQYGSDAIAGVINVILDERPEGIELTGSYGAHVTDFEPTDEEITDGRTTVLTAAFGAPFGDGFFRAGVEYKQRDATNRAGFDLVPSFEDPANIPLVGGRRNFKPGDGESENVNLWLNTATGIGDGATAYAFATYNSRDAEGTGFFRYPVSSQNILAVYPLGYRPITTGENEDVAVTGGLRGLLGDYSWDASLNFGQNSYDQGVTNSLNPSLGPTSPRSFRSASYENGQFAANVDVTRPWELGLFAPATVAFGAEYRSEFFQSGAGEPASYQAGAFPLAIGAQAGNGLQPAETRDLDRDVWSAYLELSADLSETVFVTAAARYEVFSDFGDTVAGKLAARWEFTPGYALRAAVSNSFRAPSLVQRGYGTSSTSFGAGGSLTTVNTLPVDDAVAIALGARPLEAETSVNVSAGLTAQIAEGLTATVDLYRIDVDDRITLSERIDCVPPLAAAPLCALRNITAANFFTNAINTRTDGVDVVVSYDTQAFDGALNLSLGYSYAETEVRSINPNAVPGVIVFGVEERNTVTGAAPQDRGTLTATWDNGTVSLLGRTIYNGETTRVFNFGGGFEPSQTYGATWQFDLEAGFAITEQVELFAGASNLFDQYPDESNALINYFDNLPYDVLSPIGMNGRYLYAGVRVAL